MSFTPNRHAFPNLGSIEKRPISQLKPYSRNARTHSRRQVRQIADSIERFGFTNPVLIGDVGSIICGHGRVAAAKLLGWTHVPTLQLSHLSPEERRAYILADNKLAQNASWDQDLLPLELQALIDADFEIELTGFSLAEVDIILDSAQDRNPEASDDRADLVPQISGPTVTRRGDLWLLGRHRLLCGDARSIGDYATLLDGASADLIFTDPPYNVPIDGHVCGLGRVRHKDFAMGVGEMSSAAFRTFLRETLGAAAASCRDGAIAYVCMDWRHMGELLTAGQEVFDELKNVCVWNKSNGGMGSFYRSKHELVFVFKKGMAPHINNFGLGETGRYRTNVWDYPGISSFGGAKDMDLSLHPTVKPVALVADAIEDCSKRNDIVLDCFAGSGTTLMAADQSGRNARILEFDPAYCDTIVRRWQIHTGKSAVLHGNGVTFEDVAEDRQTDVEAAE